MKQPKILLVEDSGFFRKAIAQALTAEGFVVTTAATGEEALQSANTDHPELIVLDMMLPRLDGMMVLRILRSGQETRNIPVIVLSGNSMLRDKTAAEKLGISCFIRKDEAPIEQLVVSIRAALGVAA